MENTNETRLVLERTFYKDIYSIDRIIREITSWFSNREDTECEETVSFNNSIKNDLRLIWKGVSTKLNRHITLLKNINNR